MSSKYIAILFKKNIHTDCDLENREVFDLKQELIAIAECGFSTS
jgi:hypothetical protein